jgi:hypothetical protein
VQLRHGILNSSYLPSSRFEMGLFFALLKKTVRFFNSHFAGTVQKETTFSVTVERTTVKPKAY